MGDPRNATQRYLFCDASDGTGTARSGLWTRSPLSCLERAIEVVPEMILIRFPEPIDPTQEIYVELCELLKRNRRTRDCAVAVLLPGKDRTLMDRLHSAGVDYAATVSGDGLDDRKVLDILDSLGEGQRVDHFRATLCPYLNSVALDESRAMTVCGAYLDRMVLGGRRLHELCETENHAGCEYYQNPRVRS
ncbi:hypothetical protein [Pseudodesulfovibrio karagichevae]|uniref:Uncharacterized protein n=1 Tax=Pseudodesulfovibrio karagichevae TaxID=3239305 RepID=A0ABV4K4K4_9BACT